MIRVSIFWARLAPAVKTTRRRKVRMYSIRRPKTSDMGAKINGPMARPRVKTETGRMATSRLTLNSIMTRGTDGTYTDIATVLGGSNVSHEVIGAGRDWVSYITKVNEAGRAV